MVKGCAILVSVTLTFMNPEQDVKERLLKVLQEHSRKLTIAQAEAYAAEIATALAASPERADEVIRQFEGVAKGLDGRTSAPSLSDAHLRVLARSDRETLSRNLAAPPADALQRQVLSGQLQQLTAALESAMRSRVVGSHAGPVIEKLKSDFTAESEAAAENLFDVRFKAPLPPEVLRDTILELLEALSQTELVEISDEEASRDPRAWITIWTGLVSPFRARLRAAYKAPDSAELRDLRKAWQMETAGGNERSAEDMFAESARAARAEFDEEVRRIKAGLCRPEKPPPPPDALPESAPPESSTLPSPQVDARARRSGSPGYLLILLFSLGLGAVCVTLLWRRLRGPGTRFPAKALLIALALGLLGAEAPRQSAEERRQRAGERFFRHRNSAMKVEVKAIHLRSHRSPS